MALKVPVAAVHCGFGGGSTNTEDTSVLAGLNSSAFSGLASSALSLGGASMTNTEDTSVLAGLNSSASSGIASSSLTLGGAAFAAGRGVCGGVGSRGGEAAGAGAAGSTLSSGAARSSASRASALNTLEQRPQRTYPWATRRSWAVTTSVRAHFGQTVNMTELLGCRASVALSGKAHPAVALAERSDIKARRVSACHVRDLVLHQPREHHLPARAQQ